MARYVRHARHARRSETRAQMIARNMKRRAPKPPPEPEDTTAPPEEVRGREPVGSDEYVGYHVESTDNGWHKLIGPDGEQVGKSQRSEEAAYAMIPGSDA